MLNVQICQRQKSQHFSCSHSQTSSVLSTAQIFVRKSCWKVQCCSSCSSFHIPSLSLSLAHALWQWRKKKKKKRRWLQWEVKSRKRYVLLLNPAQDWRGGSLRKEKFLTQHFLIFSCLFSVKVSPLHYHYGSFNACFLVTGLLFLLFFWQHSFLDFFFSPPPPHWSRAQSVRAVEFSFLFYSSTLVFNFV